MAQLTGKTVIVTGSSRGVGADTAQILAAEGANVVVNYRSKAPRAAKIVTSIEEAGGKAIAVQADVTNLPFSDSTFDAVTMSYGLRNVADYPKALRELYRVTKPGGRIVVLEFSTPTFAPFGKVYKKYIMQAIPPVARTISSNPESYEYLAESIIAWPNQRDLAQEFARAGWRDVKYRNLSGGIVAIHRGFKLAEPN